MTNASINALTATLAVQPSPPPRLSICIATYMRGVFIGETLRSIVSQLDARCELVIVDGGSTDDTQASVQPFADRHTNVRYVREATNSGVDRDYDKAVSYATGRHCWLMTDDDVLVPGAIDKVLDTLAGDPELLVVNAEVRTADFAAQLKPSLLPLDGPSHYEQTQADAFFVATANYLSFIGSVVIRRTVWLARCRAKYYGSHFIHVGVIFQAPALRAVRIIREPLVVIRYGNAMWSPRGFEIWLFKWPALIWSFEHFAATARRAVSERAPYRSVTKLVWYRAIGGYSIETYERSLANGTSWSTRALATLVACVPERLANAACGLFCWLRPPSAGRMAIYEMSRARQAAWLTKALARNRGIA